jgi:hypothetical protein
MSAKEFKFKKTKKIIENYEARLNEIKDILAVHSSEMRDYCFELAMLKVWKDWDDKMPVGSVIAFNDEMFLESGDKNVVDLMKLVQAIEEYAGVSETDDNDTPEAPKLKLFPNK